MFNKRGFTLMELLVVVLLIAILAAMATPQYMKVVEKQKGTEAVNLMASIGKSEERYFAVNEKYTNDFSDLDSDLVDYNSKAAATGPTYYSKYFTFQLQGLEDGTSKVIATRKGNESYVLERNYTTGRTCCGNDNTSGGDICDILDLGTTLDQCDSSPAEDNGNNGGNGGGTTPTPPSGSCSGTQPAASQICPTGCGTQTRSVTCNSSTGQWVAGNWSGTCTSPTQTQPTTQSCGSGGTQTRSCTASCSGGTCGAWSACGSQTCTATQPATTQSCGNCGTQTRSVTCNTSTGVWSTGSWTTCSGQGECTAGATKTCNSTGKQTCSSSCQWGSCSVLECATASKPSTSQSCGNCGMQTRTVTCNASTGVWSTGSWTTCAETEEPESSQGCGNCNLGTQTRSVTCNSASATWTTGSWSTCSGGGACSPGDTKLVMCGTNTGYNSSGSESFIYQNLTCKINCTWPAITPCNHCTENPYCGKTLANGQTGFCYCAVTEFSNTVSH